MYNFCFKEASLPALFVGAMEQYWAAETCCCFAASHTWRNLHFTSVGDLIQFNLLMRYEPVPSGYVKIAIENDHRNSGFSHK